MTNTNRQNAIETITNLAEALEACGIETRVTEEEDAIVLFAEMWNCNDGGTDRLEVWAEDRTNYTIEKCVNPLSRD